MAETAAIRTTLEAFGLSLGASDTHAQDAAEHAQAVANRMFAQGFHGVGQGMIQVVATLEEIRPVFAATVQQQGQAIGAVHLIANGATPEQVLVQLSQVELNIDNCRQRVQVLIDRLEHVQNQVMAALQGGNPGELITKISAAREHLVQGWQHLNTAQQSVAAQVKEARTAGN
jgi:hypothetical protein